MMVGGCSGGVMNMSVVVNLLEIMVFCVSWLFLIKCMGNNEW